ncbi:MAG TPA: hypothetical protein VD813_13330 [Pseudonocardia sp.]|nr:hypothetical protein [Pseudonocardia sp.]
MVAGWPRVWGSLLMAHVPGPGGRCTGCPRSNGSSPVWPCNLAVLGEAARVLATRPAGH